MRALALLIVPVAIFYFILWFPLWFLLPFGPVLSGVLRTLVGFAGAIFVAIYMWQWGFLCVF